MKGNINAIVTGATGFIGAALVRRLLDCGGKVAAIVRPESPNCSLLPDSPNLTVVPGDLRDVTTWREPLSGFGADVFYHLAWHGVGSNQINDPQQASNIEPSLATLKLAAELGCRRWVATGSQGEYGPLNRRISEQDLLEPTTLYGAAKAATCLLTRVLGQQLGIETVWVRVFSTYGPGDNRMLADVFKKLLHKQRPALTAGEQLWDYLYVDDAADALVAMGMAGHLSGIYNLGSGQSRTIRSIAEMARDMIDPELPLGFGEIPYRTDQVMHLEADIGRLVRDTGWRPRISLEEGVRRLVESIKNDIPDKGVTEAGDSKQGKI